MQQLSIAEDPHTRRFVSTVTLDRHEWVKVYPTAEAALREAELLELIPAADPHQTEALAEPNDWTLFTLLHDSFDDVILSDNGWTLLTDDYAQA